MPLLCFNFFLLLLLLWEFFIEILRSSLSFEMKENRNSSKYTFSINNCLFVRSLKFKKKMKRFEVKKIKSKTKKNLSLKTKRQKQSLWRCVKSTEALVWLFLFAIFIHRFIVIYVIGRALFARSLSLSLARSGSLPEFSLFRQNLQKKISSISCHRRLDTHGSCAHFVCANEWSSEYRMWGSSSSMDGNSVVDDDDDVVVVVDIDKNCHHNIFNTYENHTLSKITIQTPQRVFYSNSVRIFRVLNQQRPNKPQFLSWASMKIVFQHSTTPCKMIKQQCCILAYYTLHDDDKINQNPIVQFSQPVILLLSPIGCVQCTQYSTILISRITNKPINILLLGVCVRTRVFVFNYEWILKAVIQIWMLSAVSKIGIVL